MAALRPVVLVFQEFAEIAVAAAQPDLNTLIAGPAYHIQDFPADQTDIGIGDYASETAACDATGNPSGLPVSGTDVIVVADPPNNVIGALLESSTVEVWMDEVLVQVSQGINGSISQTPPDENLFTSSGATFVADGVAIGDRLVFTTDEGVTYLRIVQSIVNQENLRVTQNWDATTPSDDINGATPGGPQTPTSLDFRIERRLADPVQLDSSFVEISGNQITVKGGVTTLYDIDGDGTDQVAQVNFFEAYVAYLSLRQDLAVLGELEGTTEIEGAVGRIDERNPLAVGLFVAFQNTTTPLKYFGVNDPELQGYTDMLDLIEPRSDVYAIVPMSNDLAVITAVRTHVTGLADPEISNFRIGIGSSEGLPLAKTVAGPSAVGTAEQVSTDDYDVFALDGATFEADGVQAGDTLGLVQTAGTVTLAEFTVAQVFDDERLQMTATFAPLAADEVDQASHFYIYRGSGQVERTDITAEFDIAGDGAGTFHVTSGNGDVNDIGKIARLVDGTNADSRSPLSNNDYLIIDVNIGGAGGGDDLYTVVESGTAWVADTGTPRTVQIVSTVSASVDPTEVGAPTTEAVTFRQAFRRLLDTTATFSSSGVVPTDFVEVPIPAVAGGTVFTSVEQLVINSVDSENRVTFVDGSDIPTTNIDTGQTDIGYRVRRTLSKADQVDELVSVTTSIGSSPGGKRIVMVWPDSVLVSGVTNAKTGIQSPQPGYYLAAVVGGLSAGLPAHQGFTNLGVAGIDEIFNSTRYFSQTQLTELSNNGWFVFEQETESSLPYVVHQLTTDVSTTESGELSVVRDFDFVSLFYKGVLEPFIGRYNVIPSTLDLIREALNSATVQLKSQVLPRIGAPIVDAEVVSIEVLEGSKDRIEVFMEVQLPFPLNRIGLHLVA